MNTFVALNQLIFSYHVLRPCPKNGGTVSLWLVRRRNASLTVTIAGAARVIDARD
ncbi:hypothetical protein BSU04_45610 [Caballeronia sordidicola]|uniref:Uncharacterized protein n=1 Tax=Caballeronia sordidicola TaxID=196367 RepID=A0A226WKL2_CABSO|nr:hypothetical protein BSU04_45610 [Caballeronia sordidicola]